jgi:hypothetical protein
MDPYPEVHRPQWRSRERALLLPSHRAAPIIGDGIEGLRTGDADAWGRAAGRLLDELNGGVGLPAEAEVADVHSLTVSFPP